MPILNSDLNMRMNNENSPFVSLIVFFIAFMHVSNFTSYILALRIGFVQWHFWAVGIGCCLLATVFTGRLFKLHRLGVIYSIWCAAFIMVCLLSLALVDSSQAAVDNFIKYTWFIGVSFSLVLLVRTKSEVYAVGWGVVCAVLLLGVLTLMEFTDPDFQVIVDAEFADFKTAGTADRAASFYTNSNVTGIAMVLGMFVGQFFIAKKLRFVFSLFVFCAVFATVSRGALTLWAAAMVGSLVFGFFGSSGVVSRVIGLGFTFILGFLLLSGQIPSYLESLGLSELMSTDMTERLSGNFFTQGDSSSQIRLQAAGEAMNLFVNNPLMGVGLGGTNALPESGIGPHNQHLKVAAELGLLGYIIFGALLFIATIAKSIRSLVFIGLFFMISFTNHTLLEFTVFATLIPIGLVFIPRLDQLNATNVRRRRKRRKHRSSTLAESQLSA